MENKDLNIKSSSQKKSKEDIESMHIIPPLPGMAWKYTLLLKK